MSIQVISSSDKTEGIMCVLDRGMFIVLYRVESNCMAVFCFITINDSDRKLFELFSITVVPF